MSVKIFLASMVATAALLVASVQSYAFRNEVAETLEAKPAEAVTERVETLHEQMVGGEVACSEMLAQLDDLLATIDQALDTGVAEADEETYLAARDEVVQMRLDLPCLGESSLVQIGGGELGESVLASPPSEAPLPGGDPVLTGGMPSAGTYGGGVSSGGYAGARGMGGGGGGGFGGGGGGLGLMSAAAAAAIAIPIATANDDDPGQPATPAGF